MKKSVVLILAFCFIIPFVARSQNEGVKSTSNPVTLAKAPMHQGATQEMAMIQDKGTTGGAPMPSGVSSENSSLYLEPGWAQGRVLLNDLSALENIMLRYDIYHQQIQFIREDDTLAFAKPDEVSCFVLGERKFIYTEFHNGEITGKGYFEIVADGSCRLLIRRTIKYHMDPESVPSLENELYIRECEYYIGKNGEMAIPIRVCRKSVLCAFKDKEEEVKAFIRDNDLKMNTCDQLKQVVTFYNSLIPTFDP